MVQRKGLLTALALIAALLFITAGSWLFSVQGDNKLATNAPAIPDELLQAAGSTNGTFTIIPEWSEVAFLVDLKVDLKPVNLEIARLPLPSVISRRAKIKGTTNEIEGEIRLTPNGLAFASGSWFTVDLRELKSIVPTSIYSLPRALETDRFPIATFTVAEVTGFDSASAEGEEQTLQLTGIFQLHGVRREVTWDVKARWRLGGRIIIAGLATTNIRYADFNIPSPSVAGVVSVEEDLTLQVQIMAQ